jgi:hypothetical protein
MAIFKREPITHKLPTYYDDLEALGFVNLNNIEGLRVYDNPIVAEQNSTYSCKNVYKDELGNLTVRPSLLFNRKSIPCKWYYIFEDYLFVKTDTALVCYQNNDFITSTDILANSNVVPQEYFATEASIASNSIYFLVSNSEGYLRFLKFENSSFTQVEGEIQTVNPDEPDISAYNILNKYQGEKYYLKDSPRTADDYTVINALLNSELAYNNGISDSIGYNTGFELRYLDDTNILIIDYSDFKNENDSLDVKIYLYTYTNRKWTVKDATITLTAREATDSDIDSPLPYFNYTVTEDMSNNYIEIFMAWKAKLAIYSITIGDVLVPSLLFEKAVYYSRSYYTLPLYDYYFIEFVAYTGDNNRDLKISIEQVDIESADYTIISSIELTDYGGPIKTKLDNGKLVFDSAYGIPLVAACDKNKAYILFGPMGYSRGYDIFKEVCAITALEINYSEDTPTMNILYQTDFSTTGRSTEVSDVVCDWYNTYSSYSRCVFAAYCYDRNNKDSIKYIVRTLHNIDSTGVVESDNTTDLSAFGDYNDTNYANSYIMIASKLVTMKHFEGDTFVVYNTNSNTTTLYSNKFKYDDTEFVPEAIMILDNGQSIVGYNSSGILFERRAVAARSEYTERDITTIPLLTDIMDKPITGFYLANTYWFITEHYIFGTGAANEKLTIEFFDPYKYFAVSESITAAIRLSDTSFWVFHDAGAYLIYRTTTTDSDDNTVYRWLITNTAKSKGCDFENAVVTLPVTSYIAVVTSDDISSIQMKENIQSDERSLVPLTMNLEALARECLDETDSVKVATYRYLALFILNRTEKNGTTPVLVYDPNTSNWWYWELPVNEVYHVVQTETNVELLCDYDSETVIYNLTTDWYTYNIGNLSYDIYADRLSDSTEPSQIEWIWESAVQLFNSVDYRKQLLSTTFTFGEYNKRLLDGTMEYNELSFRHEFEIYADKYSERDLGEEHDLTVERAKNRMVPTVIASFTYLQLILKNTPYDPEEYEFDMLCKPQISGISFKYRTLEGGIT